MEEEKPINVGDLTKEKSEKSISEAIPCSQPRISESFAPMSQNRSQQHDLIPEEPNIIQEEPMICQKLAADAMDIENENKENKKSNSLEVFGRATILSDALSFNFEDEEDKEPEQQKAKDGLEDLADHFDKEKMKDVPIVRKRSILKKGLVNDSESEKGSVRSRSRSRSNSRSGKRVQFQGLSEDDNESEKEVNPRLQEKKEQKKSQISMISKLLQQRLEKEEQERRIANPPEPIETAAIITAGTFQQTDTEAQQKTISKLLHIPEGTPEMPVLSISSPKANATTNEANLIHQHMANNHLTFTLKPPTNSNKIKETKPITKEVIKPAEIQSKVTGKTETAKALITEYRKKLSAFQDEKTARLNLLMDSKPEKATPKGKVLEEKKASATEKKNDKKVEKVSKKDEKVLKRDDKVSMKDQKTNRKDEKDNKKSVASTPHFQETLESFSFSKKAANESQNQRKAPQPETSKPKEITSSKGQHTWLKGHFKNDEEEDSAKKKNLLDKILKAREMSPNQKGSKGGHLGHGRDEDSNLPRNFMVGSQSTEDNSKSIHQEIEEFLQKVRERRDQEKIENEDQDSYEEPDEQNKRGFYIDDDEEDDDGLLVPTKTYSEKNKKKPDSSRSKISVRNAGNMDISLEFDDYRKLGSGNHKSIVSKSGKPIKKIIIEPTPNEEDSGYEEIILVRRKVKPSNTTSRTSAPQHKRRLLQEEEDEPEYVSSRAADVKHKNQQKKEAKTTRSKPEKQANSPVRRYSTRSKTKAFDPRYSDDEDEESNSAEEGIYIDSDPEPPVQKKTKTHTGAVPANLPSKAQKTHAPARAETKKNQEQEKEKASDTVRRLLEGKPKPKPKPKPNPQTKSAPGLENPLIKNKKGEESRPLSQKLAGKKNLIEDEHQDEEPEEFEDNNDTDENRSLFHFDDISSEAINRLQALNHDQLFTGKKKQRPKAGVSKSMPVSQDSQESLVQRAKPLVSLKGTVLTQSEHLRKLKKAQQASKSSQEELDPKAKNALGKLFGMFIDKATL